MLRDADFQYYKYEKMSGLRDNGKAQFKSESLKRTMNKAEELYESALEYLQEQIDVATRDRRQDELLRWLDRDVNPEPGYAPDTTAAGVPRIRGSKSKYTLVESDPVVGVRLRKHWRQREALSKAALELLYAEPEEDVLTDQQRQKLREKFNELLRIGLDDEF